MEDIRDYLSGVVLIAGEDIVQIKGNSWAFTTKGRDKLHSQEVTKKGGECKKCRGTGKPMYSDFDKCMFCKGTGHTADQKKTIGQLVEEFEGWR